MDKAPLESYADIGGLETQIQEIKEAVELPLAHPELYEEVSHISVATTVCQFEALSGYAGPPRERERESSNDASSRSHVKSSSQLSIDRAQISETLYIETRVRDILESLRQNPKRAGRHQTAQGRHPVRRARHGPASTHSI